MSRRGTLAVLFAAPALLVGCGAAGGEAESTAPATVANVGNLPEPLSVHATTTTTDEATETTLDTTTDDTTADEEPTETTDEPVETTEPTDDNDESSGDEVDEDDVESIGDLADGPRVLLLGDSVTESIGERYSGGVCRELVPLGWEVAMDAETGRFIGDGFDVLERRLAEREWDAAVLNFGSNYRGDPADYGLTLRRMLNRLLPRPVLLVTVSEPVENRAEVNYVLREAGRRYENVRLLEWSEETRNDGSLTAGDGLHLSSAGQERLVEMIAEALGDAPGRSAGDCIDFDAGDADDTDGTSDVVDGDSGGFDAPTVETLAAVPEG